MSERIDVPQVGAPDPDLRNSPIIEETDEEFDLSGQEMVESDLCYFNGHAYRDGSYVCSGSELLRCLRGNWVRQGSCDPDNP